MFVYVCVSVVAVVVLCVSLSIRARFMPFFAQVRVPTFNVRCIRRIYGWFLLARVCGFATSHRI